MSCCHGSCNGRGMGLLVVALAGLAAVGATVLLRQGDAPAPAPATPVSASAAAPAASPLDLTVERIDGSSQDLSAYKGKVVVIVNTASRCGFTPQYAGLQSLFDAKKDAGLVVLGFPANNFMGQEPGTNEEIAAFCEKNYGVTFPMFAKISVKGEDMHLLYQRLTSLPEPLGGDIKWNFTKFVVDRDGKVVQRFGSRTKPDDKEFLEAIDRLLAQPATPGA